MNYCYGRVMTQKHHFFGVPFSTLIHQFYVHVMFQSFNPPVKTSTSNPRGSRLGSGDVALILVGKGENVPNHPIVYLVGG